MATSDISSVQFACLHKGTFYFQGLDFESGDCETDTFQKSSKCHEYLLRSSDNKYLLLSDDGQFVGQNLTIQALCQSSLQFKIQCYNDSSTVSRKGRAVIMYSTSNGKKMVVCCSNEHDVNAEAMDLPNQIHETAHKALFFLTRISMSDKYLFESSLYPQLFLGFEEDSANPSLDKLVLHQKIDQVDESCEIAMIGRLQR